MTYQNSCHLVRHFACQFFILHLKTEPVSFKSPSFLHIAEKRDGRKQLLEIFLYIQTKAI
jgi:hypothetical protein